MVLVWTNVPSPLQLGFQETDAATLAFAKHVIDGSRGGDVKIVADIDGDGYKDLIVGGLPGENLRWHRYPSWATTTIAVPESQFHTDGEAGDVDGDGDLDIVVPDDAGTDRLQWFENPLVRPGGTGNPSDGSQWTKRVIASTSGWGKDVELSDFDSNGLLDVGVRFPFEHAIFFQTTPNVWSRQVFSVNHVGLEGMDSGDVDRDGDMDLIVEGAWLRNPGGSAARNPASWSTFQIGATPGEFKAVVANIDGDIANEIVFSSSEGVENIAWWDPVSGNPTGSWVGHVIAPPVQGAHTLQTADMDNDGDIDVVVGQMHTTSERELAIFLNNGVGDGWQKYQVDQGTGIHNGVVADIGNDGDFDIFGANWAGNPPVTLWENLIGSGSDTAPPSIPTGLSATTVSATQINLSWTASTDNVGVSGYRVFRNGTAVGTPATTSFADTSLASATTYTYRVSARDAAGNESGQSVALSATTATPDTIPPVLTNVTAANITSAGATITWTTDESATSRVDYGTTTAYGSTASISGVRTTHSLPLTGLQPSTTYHYRAISVDASGIQGSSADFTFTTQATSSPSDPIAHWPLDDGSGTTVSDAAGGNGGTLVNGAAWVPGKIGTGVGFDGTNDYIALPNMDVGGSGLTIAAWVKSSSFSSLSDQRFVVKSTDTAEQSHYWMVGQTNTGQNRLRFRVKTNGTTTTLIAASGDLPLNTWYHVAATYDGTAMRLYLNGTQVGTQAKSGPLSVNSAVPVNIGRSPDGSSHMHGNIDDVRIYSRALNATEITTLASAADTTPPSTPTGVSATTVSTTQINLSWTASTDNVGVSGYRVFRNGTAVATPTTTSFADTGLTPETTYTYRVSARDAAGNESGQSVAVSATTATPPDTTPPSTPTGVSATTVSTTQINLSWTSSTDNVGVSDYRVFRNGTAVGTPSAASYADTGLTPATTYTYRVSARDAAGNESGQSAAVSATTATAADTTPPVLTSVTAGNITSTGATITWTTNESATSRVDYGTTTAYGSTASISGVRTAHSVPLAGLQPSTAYHYRAISLDASGNPGSSADFTFTTQATSGPSDPITFDAAASKVETDNNNNASLTLAHGALTNGYIVVGVSMYDPEASASITTVTYGGTAMTTLGTAQSTNAYTEVYLFGLAVGNRAAGNYVVAVTASTGIDQLVVGAAAFANVRQTGSTGPFASATGWNTLPSVNVGSAAGDLVVDILGHDSGSGTLGPNQALNWKQEDGTDRSDGVSSREQATGTTTTMSHTKATSAPWSIAAVALKRVP